MQNTLNRTTDESYHKQRENDRGKMYHYAYANPMRKEIITYKRTMILGDVREIWFRWDVHRNSGSANIVRSRTDQRRCRGLRRRCHAYLSRFRGIRFTAFNQTIRYSWTRYYDVPHQIAPAARLRIQSFC